MKMPFFVLLTALVAFLAACGSPAAAPTAQVASSPTTVLSSPTATSTATTVPLLTQPAVETTSAKNNPSPTETVASEAPAPAETGEIAAAEIVNWLKVEGKTDDGFTYLGNPDAPVTMIDYSDFL